MNEDFESLRAQARNSMHETLAALHAQHGALVRDGRGEHAEGHVLRQRIREQEDLLRRLQA